MMLLTTTTTMTTTTTTVSLHFHTQYLCVCSDQNEQREEVNNWKRRSRLISLSGHSLLLLLLLNGLILLPRIMGRSFLLSTWSTEAFQTVSADDDWAELCWPPLLFLNDGGSSAVACVSFQASKIFVDDFFYLCCWLISSTNKARLASDYNWAWKG